MIELKLTKANRIKLAAAFGKVKRVDFGIDCAIEGQMGKAYTDNPEQPGAFKIEVGPFCYFAGNADSGMTDEIMRDFQPGFLLMPSADGWIDTTKKIHGDQLIPFERYSFSSENLSLEHLKGLLQCSALQSGIVQIDAENAARILSDFSEYADISDFDSIDDFVARGVGFCLIDKGSVVGIAYSSLVCSRGIEVSIFVLPDYRRQGVATALACRLLNYCLENGLDPHWDAANIESCKLAEKLGYVFIEKYEAYYLKR